MDYANCRGEDPNLFFPKVQSDRARSEQYAHFSRAVAICNKCMVKDTCLEYAVARPSTEGIWGGTTQRERVDIRRERRYAATDGEE